MNSSSEKAEKSHYFSKDEVSGIISRSASRRQSTVLEASSSTTPTHPSHPTSPDFLHPSRILGESGRSSSVGQPPFHSTPLHGSSVSSLNGSVYQKTVFVNNHKLEKTPSSSSITSTHFSTSLSKVPTQTTPGNFSTPFHTTRDPSSQTPGNSREPTWQTPRSIDSRTEFCSDFSSARKRKLYATKPYSTTPTSSCRNTTETPRASSRASRTPNPNNSSIFGEVDKDCVVAVIEGRGNARGEVGLVSISITNPTLSVCQFSDSRTYVRTLNKIAVWNPGEILVPVVSNTLGIYDPNAHKLFEDIIERFSGANITHIHRKYFNNERGLQMIKHLCAPEYKSVELQLRHQHYGLAAANCVLKYIEFIQNINFAPKSIKIEFQASMDSMMIDVDSAKHVELLASSLNARAKKSLFGVMNRCSTTNGTKHLRAALFQPSVKDSVIEERLEAVSELVSRPEVLAQLQTTLGRICNIDGLLTLCAILPKRGDTLSLVEQRINQVIGLKTVLELMPMLVTSLSVEIQSETLKTILSILQDPVYTEMHENVKEIICDEARTAKGSGAMRLQRCIAIKSGLNGLLDVARQTFCELVDDIESLIKQISDTQGLPMRLGFNITRGYHIQVKKADLFAVKGKKFKLKDLPSSFLHPQLNKSHLVFSTEEIVKMDQQGQNALREITLMSNVIVDELIISLREKIGSIFKLSDAISNLDLICSFADVSSSPGYVRPRFGPCMQIKSSRHPILDKMELLGTELVPNDISAMPIEANFQVITGPNMCGKSTYLKQIVLLQIMAQSGCYVPADSDAIPIFRICDSIFSRVSMSDSIECNASTFEMEMKETAYILQNLTQASLVIIDELGRGTSTEEGSALCWAISEEFANSAGAFTFLATHFQIITKLEDCCIGVVNNSFMTELSENSDIIQTHKIVRGSNDVGSTHMQNYGLHLAKKLHIPESAIEKAHEMVRQLEAEEKQIKPEISQDDIQAINCFKFALTLKKLATKEDMEKEELLDKAKELQKMFRETESDEEDDLMNEFDQEFTN